MATFTQLKRTLDLAEKVKVDAGEKIVSTEKVGKGKKIEATITTKSGKFFVYFDGEKYAGSYRNQKDAEKVIADYLKLVGEELTEVRGKAGSSDGDEEADKNIIMQLHKVVSLRGMKPVVFDNGKSMKVDPKVADKLISMYQSLKPASKLQLQKVLSKSPEMFKKAVSQLNINEYFDDSLEEGKSSTGYELYHKDFSSAMKHAYEFAKKKFKIDVDPKEIDDKVASGPRKPSKGKTNSYRLLDKDGKRAIQVQVYGMDNGKYELNMYKEEVELDEAKAPFDVSKADYAGAAKELTDYAKKRGGIDKDEFLSFANRMASIAKKKSPSVLSKFARDLSRVDTSPREKIVDVMRNNGIKISFTNKGFQIENLEEEYISEESNTIAKVKEIVAKKSAMKIDGVLVDMFTASMISKVYDAVNDANKKKMDGLKIDRLAQLALKVYSKQK